MPSKKKKYNARFPAGRIKKIMQTDEEIGKVAQAVPVIISRTLELFVEELITKTMQVTMMKNARTLSPHHMKQCILSESRFDFLKDLVKSVPEVATSDDDLGSYSDNSSTVQIPRQRSNSRDTTIRPPESAVSSRGPSFYTETENEPLRNSQIGLEQIDEDSSDSDELEISENSPGNPEVNLIAESVNPSSVPVKDDDSEDYDT